MAKVFQVDTGGTLTTSLVSYWPFEGDSNDFYGSNNGTDTSMSYSSTSGKVGQHSVYSGSGKVAFTTTAAAPSVSWAFWFKSDGTTGCLLNSDNAGHTASLNFFMVSGAIRVETYNGSSGQSKTTASSGYGDSAWHFCVVTLNSTTLSVSIDNGSFETTTAGTQNITTGGNKCSFGNQDSTSSDFFTGRLDEMGYWTKILSSQEVTDLYNSGNGQTMIDQSGPANVKTYNGLAAASDKTVNGLAIGSVKTWNGLT